MLYSASIILIPKKNFLGRKQASHRHMEFMISKFVRIVCRPWESYSQTLTVIKILPSFARNITCIFKLNFSGVIDRIEYHQSNILI